MWREIFGRNVTQVDIDPLGNEPFHAKATFQALPNIALAFGSRSPARYTTGRRQLVRARDGFGLTLPASGASTTIQLGRELVAEPGEAIIISGADPSVSTMHRSGRVTTIALPRQPLAALVPNLEAAYASTIPASNRALGLLIRYISMLRRSDCLKDPNLASAADAHIIDLAALAIGASRDAARLTRERSVAAARLATIKSDVAARLAERDLSVATIAVRHGITPRYVQRLFEREGTTFSAFLLNSRLALAFRMLSSPQMATRTISAIAFECGFGDLSYFNRTFRRIYGARPSEVREATRRAASHHR